MVETGRSRKGRYGISALVVTAALMLFILGISFFALHQIYRLEEERCFEHLYEEADDLARQIQHIADSDREQMQTLARLSASYDDLADPELWELLEVNGTPGGIARLEFLLPDGSLLTSVGRQETWQGGPSFAQEAALGTHITDRETDQDGSPIVRSYAPVVRDGETVAMLSGVIELGSLPDAVELSVYGGQGSFYIIDGNTGAFLLDTWHTGTELGNIWALGEREMAPGYDHERLKQGLIQGEKNYVVFVSETTGSYLYFYYEPLQINQWRVALSVPEHVVFEGAHTIRVILSIFLTIEILSFLLYFLWILRYSRREANEKQRQLDTVSAIYDVEKLLFTAHEKQDNVHLALEKIGYITSARGVAFLVTGRGVPASFLWAKRREQAHPLWSSQLAACLESHFAQGRDEVSAESPEELRELFPGVQLPPIRNLLALPVTDMDGIQCGILTAVDMEDFRSGAPALRSVSFSFSMFCHNLLLYNHLVKQSQTDALTGLKNRNRYEQDLPELNHAFRRSLACVYVDANGLHELNNTEGHAAGDSMLRTIAARLLVCFESPYTYRIGGDEFVALIPDLKAGEVERLCRGLTEELAAEHIHVSSGFAWASGDLALPELIKRAEEDMYAKKAAFYQRKTDGRRQSRKSAPRP